MASDAGSVSVSAALVSATPLGLVSVSVTVDAVPPPWRFVGRERLGAGDGPQRGDRQRRVRVLRIRSLRRRHGAGRNVVDEHACRGRQHVDRDGALAGDAARRRGNRSTGEREAAGARDRRDRAAARGRRVRRIGDDDGTRQRVGERRAGGGRRVVVEKEDRQRRDLAGRDVDRIECLVDADRGERGRCGEGKSEPDGSQQLKQRRSLSHSPRPLSFSCRVRPAGPAPTGRRRVSLRLRPDASTAQVQSRDLSAHSLRIGARRVRHCNRSTGLRPTRAAAVATSKGWPARSLSHQHEAAEGDRLPRILPAVVVHPAEERRRRPCPSGSRWSASCARPDR